MTSGPLVTDTGRRVPVGPPGAPTLPSFFAPVALDAPALLAGFTFREVTGLGNRTVPALAPRRGANRLPDRPRRLRAARWNTRSGGLLRDHRSAAGLHDTLPDVTQSARDGGKVPVCVVPATARSTTCPSPLDQAIRAAITPAPTGVEVEGVPRPGYACSRSGVGKQETAFGEQPSSPHTALPNGEAVCGKAVLQDCAGGGRPAERSRWPAAYYRGATCYHEPDAAKGLSAIIPLSRTYADGADCGGTSAPQGGA